MTHASQPSQPPAPRTAPLPAAPVYSRKKTPTSLFDNDEPVNIVRGEAALWQAVITQALMDASSGSRKHEARHEREEAQRWLCGMSKDFVQVCLNAGLEPDYVRTRAAQALQRGCVWRAAAGQGPKALRRKRLAEEARLRAQAEEDDCIPA